MKHPRETVYTTEPTNSLNVNTDKQTITFYELGGAKIWVSYPIVYEYLERKK
jgi:hypothetical protein